MELLSIIVGFMGVVVTMLWNAWLARRQQDRQWETNRQVLRQGLITELKGIERVLKNAVSLLDEAIEGNKDREKGKEGYVLIGSIASSPLYLASLSQIGCLTQSEVAVVVAGYQVLSRQDQRARILPGNKIMEEMTTKVHPSNNMLYREALNVVRPRIEDAITELGRVIS